MTASQRAKEKCGKHSNKSTTESKAAECCCMVAPWVIEEEKRSYKLKVTKVGQDRHTGIDVSDKEEHTNKEKNRYELHIVTSPPSIHFYINVG